MNLDFSDLQIAEGRALLKRLLPDLKREISLSRTGDVIQPVSLIGQSMMGRIRERNLDALVIRRSAGGWHADLILTGMPAGVSNVMGTPEADPLPDRDTALAAGTQILRQLCRLSMENEIAGRDMPERNVRPFDLHGFVFDIPGEMVDRIGEVWTAVGQAIIPDAEAARAQLTANLTRLMGEDRFDPDLYAALPEEERGRLAVNMATLMLFREVRHPDRPVAQPVEEDPSP
jgi:hypothetical protein